MPKPTDVTAPDATFTTSSPCRGPFATYSPLPSGTGQPLGLAAEVVGAGQGIGDRIDGHDGAGVPGLTYRTLPSGLNARPLAAGPTFSVVTTE